METINEVCEVVRTSLGSRLKTRAFTFTFYVCLSLALYVFLYLSKNAWCRPVLHPKPLPQKSSATLIYFFYPLFVSSELAW